jgi:hypothetical protein
VNDASLPEETVEAWTRDCPFVFSGRVQAFGASNLDGVDPDDRMATVKVEDVAIAPRDLGDLRGQTVTVYLKTTKGLTTGQRTTFFGQSWHYGRTVGIVEVGRTTSPPAEIRRTVVGIRLRQLEEQIEERIRNAEVIVSGRVLATYPVERPEGLPGLVEGVEWWNADLWIGSVEKGQPPQDGRIWFPEGGDRDWGPVPKAYPGQTGVWFLRPVAEAGRKPTERRLMAVDPLDYHASSDLPRIQALLWRASEGSADNANPRG